MYRARTCSFGALIRSNCCRRAGSGGHMTPIEGPYRALERYMGAAVHQFVQHASGPHVVSQRPRSPYISEIEPGVPLGEYLVDPGGLTGDHLGDEPIQHSKLAELATTSPNPCQAPNLRRSLDMETCCWRRPRTVEGGSQPRRSSPTLRTMCIHAPSESSSKPAYLRRNFRRPTSINTGPTLY